LVESAKFAGLPMAEPSEREYKRLAETFCKAYNSEHNSSFKFSHVNPESDDIDFFLKDESGNLLPIQHTRCEHFTDFMKRFQLSIRLIRQLSTGLESRGLGSHVVRIFLSRSPSTDAQLHEVVEKLLAVTERLVQLGLVGRDLRRYELREYELDLEYVRCIGILPSESSKPLVIPVSEDWVEVRAVTAEADDLRSAIERKMCRYGSATRDVILLLHSCPFPPESHSIEKAQAELETQPPPFREVWVVNEANDGLYRRLWPLSV